MKIIVPADPIETAAALRWAAASQGPVFIRVRRMQATRLTARFAELTGAMPVYLPAPGLVGTPVPRLAGCAAARVDQEPARGRRPLRVE